MHREFNPQRAFIFRITHRNNLAWIAQHGLHCATSQTVDPAFVEIGNAGLIQRRSARIVKVPPGGTLSDYVPFYFTPFSPMFFNIHTGWNVPQRSNDEIVIVVSSLHRLLAENVPFLFTDRHAYMTKARFSNDLADLQGIDWTILQARNFSRDNDDPEKVERYEAEALVYKHLPLNAIIGVACYTDQVTARANEILYSRNLQFKAITKQDWYF